MPTRIDPAILPADEELRLAALRRYDLLDTPPDGSFDRITALAAKLFDVPVAIVSLVDRDRIWFKSHHGLDVTEIGRDAGLCASAILHPDLWVVNDAPADPRALANPLVAGEFGLRFYAGAPLTTPDGYNLGTLCVLDFEPRELSAREAGMLVDLASLVMDDISLRLVSRRTLLEMAERQDLRDAFIGMLSHELRTPVTSIYAAASLLGRSRNTNLDSQERDLLADITSESDRLRQLIEDLLVLTKVEAGELTFQAEPLLLQRLVPVVVAREARRWRGRAVEVHLPSDLPPVLGDPIFMEQVVANLVSNALKYSSAQDPVEVSATHAHGDVEVRVQDRGIGIDPGKQEWIFGLLARTPEAVEHAGGAGVGLYVCRRLVEVMGGSIWVEAAPDRGSVFAFRVPVAID